MQGEYKMQKNYNHSAQEKGQLKIKKVTDFEQISIIQKISGSYQMPSIEQKRIIFDINDTKSPTRGEMLANNKKRGNGIPTKHQIS